jgi:hypothetical protein
MHRENRTRHARRYAAGLGNAWIIEGQIHPAFSQRADHDQCEDSGRSSHPPHPERLAVAVPAIMP